MLLVLDLGFSSLVVLVACAVFPLIGLVVRSKWRRSAARKEEIRRLMILASEEAARAELEASGAYGYSYGRAYADDYIDGYGAVPAAQSNHSAVSAAQSNYSAVSAAAQSNHCALCYAPTTTRCAQCKAVRYCSGKCQIIHWRQGHRDECHPPAIKSEFDQKPSKHKRDLSSDSNVEDDTSLQSKSDGESNVVDSTEASKVKHSNLKVDFNAESSSESSGTRFSGFPTSSTSNESSDDVSICDSIGSNDSRNSDGHFSDDAAHGISSRTSSSAEDVDQAKTISPKFASLVDSADTSGSRELNQRIAASFAGQPQYKETSPSHSGKGSMQDDLLVEPHTSSATFWEGAIDPAEPTGHPRDASAQLNTDRKITNNLSDSNLNCSANSSGSNMRGHALLHEPAPNKKSNCESTSKRLGPCNTSSTPLLKTEVTVTRSGSANCSDLSRSSEAGSSSLPANTSSGSKKDGPSSESMRNISVGACASGRNPDHIVRSKKVDEVNPVAQAVHSDARTVLKISVENSADQLKSSILSRQYSLRGGSDIAGRYSGKGLFPYELFVKLYTWKEVELRPCGFINCGNSCYANAVLQCLAFTPPLTAYFLQGLHSKMCAKKDWCFMCEFESLILKAKKGESPVSPFGIVSRLECIGSHLSNGREEDAHEFLRYAIDAMESICLTESQASSSSDMTLLGLTFGGYLRSKIRCTKCQGKSERHERIMDLSVEIEGDIGTLEEALRRFTLSETLDGDNKYQCSRCGTYEKAKKKLTILEAPNVLTIALKRFQSGKYGGKLNKSIRYPEILNLAPYMSGTSDKSPVYRLYGVIVHLDVMNTSYSGHYICYVKNPQNKWFKIDDSTVTPADMETVSKVGAYILLYSRCSPRAPRSIRNQIISCEVKRKPLPSRMISRIPSLNTKPWSDPSHDDLHPNLASSDGLANIESFYSQFNRARKMLEEDSPSDSSSLFSNTSDESISSSDGTRDSTCSTDDYSESLFGGWNSPWRSSSDSESSSSLPTTSSSSSSPMASSDRRAPGFPETSGPQADAAANNSFLHRDTSKSRANLLGSSSVISRGNFSNCRETNLERLVDAANGFDGVKSGRRSASVNRTESVIP